MLLLVALIQIDAFLKASDADGSDYFGQTLAIDGEYIVVGSTYDDSSENTSINDGSNDPNQWLPSNNYTTDSGAAYVFKRTDSGEWVQDAKLKPPYRNASRYFGQTVDIKKRSHETFG